MREVSNGTWLTLCCVAVLLALLAKMTSGAGDPEVWTLLLTVIAAVGFVGIFVFGYRIIRANSQNDQ